MPSMDEDFMFLLVSRNSQPMAGLWRWEMRRGHESRMATAQEGALPPVCKTAGMQQESALCMLVRSVQDVAWARFSSRGAGLLNKAGWSACRVRLVSRTSRLWGTA